MNYLLQATTGTVIAYEIISAYKALSFRIPKEWNVLTRLQGNEMESFAQINGVYRNISIFIADLNGEIAKSFGNHSLSSSDLAIIIAPEWIITNPEQQVEKCLAMNFVMRHEYAHLRHNDMGACQSIKALISLSAAILGWKYLPSWAMLATTVISGYIARVLYSRRMENRADNEAIQSSNQEECQAFLNLLLKEKEINYSLRSYSILNCLLISPQGDRRYVIGHPSLSSRIANLKKSLP